MSSSYAYLHRWKILFIKQKYVSSLKEIMKCKRNGNLYIDLPIENIYYEGYIIKYLDNNYNIDKL